jgi:hypothetical protein
MSDTKDDGFRMRTSIDDEDESRSSVENRIRAINSGNGLYKTNMKGGNTIVIDSHRGYRMYTRVGVKQWVRQAQ